MIFFIYWSIWDIKWRKLKYLSNGIMVIILCKFFFYIILYGNSDPVASLRLDLHMIPINWWELYKHVRTYYICMNIRAQLHGRRFVFCERGSISSRTFNFCRMKCLYELFVGCHQTTYKLSFCKARSSSSATTFHATRISFILIKIIHLNRLHSFTKNFP